MSLRSVGFALALVALAASALSGAQATEDSGGVRVDFAAAPDGARLLLVGAEGGALSGGAVGTGRLFVAGPGDAAFAEVPAASLAAGLRGQPLGADARLAVSPEGVAFLLQPGPAGLTLARSDNGGASWMAVPSAPPLPVPEEMGELEFAAGRDGALAVAWRERYEIDPLGSGVNAESPVHRVWVTMSADGGRTFLGSANLAVTPSTRLGDLAFHPGDAVANLAVASPDGDITLYGMWSSERQVRVVASDEFTTGPLVGPPALAFTRDGRAHAMWAEQTENGAALQVASRQAGAASWSLPQSVAEASAGTGAPSVSADTLGRLVVALAEADRVHVLTVDSTGAPVSVTTRTVEPTGVLSTDVCAARSVCDHVGSTLRGGVEVTPDGRVHAAWPMDAESTAYVSFSPDAAAEAAATSTPVPRPVGDQGRNGHVGLAAVSAAVLVGGYALWRWVLPPVLRLYSRIADDEALDHPTRQALRDLVASRPGSHFRALARALDLSHGNLEHHLRVLTRAGVLTEVETPTHRCFFLPGDCTRDVARALAAVRSEGARTVLAAAHTVGPANLSALAAEAHVAVSTAHHHVRRLERAGILSAGLLDGALTIHVTDLGRRVLDALAPE